MSGSFYLRARGEVKGPASITQIIGLIRKKRLGRHHDISIDGVSWVRAGEMPDLAEYWAPDTSRATASDDHAGRGQSASFNLTENKGDSRVVEWFYASGKTRLGPVSESQLRGLFDCGAISGNTLIWHSGLEEWVQGQTVAQFMDVCRDRSTALVKPPTFNAEPQAYCMNCGNTVSTKDIACTRCGVPPRAEKNFCYSCGVAVNQNQVMCIQCGAGLAEPRSVGAGIVAGSKNKTSAGILALLLGGLGIHKFYHGSWGWGLVYLAACITWIPAIVALGEGIQYLTMDQAKYDNQYNQTAPSAFKW